MKAFHDRRFDLFVLHYERKLNIDSYLHHEIINKPIRWRVQKQDINYTSVHYLWKRIT